MTLLFPFFSRRHMPAVALVVLGAATVPFCAACGNAPTHRSAHHRLAVTSSTADSATPTTGGGSAFAPRTTLASPSKSQPQRSDRPSDSPASRSVVTHRPVTVQSPTSTSRPSLAPGTAVASQVVVAANAPAGYKVFTNSDRTLVRWNPCTPIHYAVNVRAAGDPASALSDVRAAVAAVASATGLTFVYDGQTASVPTKAWLDDGTGAGAAQSALLIAWAPPGAAPGDSDLFGNDADGEGGWWESGASNDGVHWVWQIKRAFVVIDPAGAVGYAPGFGPGESRGVLLMHELGHAVGLGHTDNQRDVMFPAITAASRAVWGPGDLLGLGRLGSAGGCIY